MLCSLQSTAVLSGDGVDLTCQLAVLDAKMLRQMLLS